MRKLATTVGPLAGASANAIALSQTPVSGTALTLNGTLVNAAGVAVLDTPRRILLTYGNEGSARTLVLTGTNWSGNPISEILAVPSGAGGTVASVLDYATLTSALPLGGGWTAAVTLGTNGVAASPWLFMDEWGLPGIIGALTVTGTVNYTVQLTQDNPNANALQTPVTLSSMVWFNSSDVNVVGATTNQLTSFTYAPCFIRILLNSGSGSVTGKFTQIGPGVIAW